MNIRLNRLLAVAVAVGALASGFLSAGVSAQTPEPGDGTPTATPAAPEMLTCPPNRPDEQPERAVSLDEITVVLPAGRFTTLESPPNSGGLLVCFHTSAGVKLSGSDCTELGRFVTTGGQHVILDAIVDACTVGSATPTATAHNFPPPVCPPDGLESRPARLLSVGGVTVSVPHGFWVAYDSPPGSGGITVCYAGSAGIRLSTTNCAETGRFNTAGDQKAALDAIAASCVLGAPPNTPTPTPTGDGSITPPDTGNAGLR